MPIEYFSWALASQLVFLFALLYRAHVRKHKRQRRHMRGSQKPGNVYIVLSHLIEEIDEWQDDHPGIPLSHPEIQPSVNQLVGNVELLLNMREHVPNRDYLVKWRNSLLPFVGVEALQKESG